MDFKILGLPFNKGEFKICQNYRGICRNEIPEPGFKEEYKVEFLNELHFKLISGNSQQMPISELLAISDSFTELSTESFELIILIDILEEYPKDILHKSLGYEVIASNETSMIHFWLRKKVKSFERLYSIFKEKLNDNYLFSCINDAQAFIEEIKQHSYIISSPSRDIDFRIVEIAKIEAVKNEF